MEVEKKTSIDMLEKLKKYRENLLVIEAKQEKITKDSENMDTLQKYRELSISQLDLNKEEHDNIKLSEEILIWMAKEKLKGNNALPKELTEWASERKKEIELEELKNTS
jgi:hypothetical protein